MAEFPKGAPMGESQMQPDVHKFLEAVFAVAPQPEEYVKYRLHLATALSPEFLESWFEKRRVAAKEQMYNPMERFKPKSSGAEDTISQQTHVPAFSLFGETTAPPPVSLSYEQRSLALLASTTREVQDVGRLLTIMQASNNWDPSRPSSEGEFGNVLETCRGNDTTASDQSGDLPQSGGNSRVQNGDFIDVANLAVRSEGGEGDAVPTNRFTEADLGVISRLVGLETINSRETHCGSHSLYMFEQLTALDSLDFDTGGGAKRKRTRHQHFWRNTDKLDPRDRVYVQTASLQRALVNDQPVVPKNEISPDERTNSWTVCLTTSGVIGYLNKRISPLGVQMIRTLAGTCQAQRQSPAAGKLRPVALKPEPLRHDSSGPGFRRVKPKVSPERREAIPAMRSTSLSLSDGVSISDGGKSGDKNNEEQAYAFQPVPRARRRKPL